MLKVGLKIMDFLNKILKIVRPNSQYHFKFRLQIFILFIRRFFKEILNSRIEKKTSESVIEKSQNNENMINFRFI